MDENKNLNGNPKDYGCRAKPVANVKASVKKKGLGEKIKETFLPDDISSIKNYIWLDVIVPTVKNVILDCVSVALTGSAFGPRRSSVPAQKIAFTNYNTISSPRTQATQTRSSMATYEYDMIEFDNRGAAEAVLEELDEIINHYGVVSVLDLYTAAGLDCDYTANNWGWYNIRMVEPVRTRNGKYMLKFPKAVPVKNG